MVPPLSSPYFSPFLLSLPSSPSPLEVGPLNPARGPGGAL